MTPLETINQQPQESISHDPEQLDYIKVWNTIQGEGPFVGTPAVFVRLAGCNLMCPMCDTNYTQDRKRTHFSTIVKEVQAQASNGLVVITGGEPFRQDINNLVRALLAEDYHVQIETNGTLANDQLPYSTSMSVICSPKTPKIHPNLIPHIYAYKYVIQADKVDEDGLPNSILGSNFAPARPATGYPKTRIFVQPLDEGDEVKNLANLYTAVQVCLKKGYRLSLQTHKAIGLE